MPRPHLIPGKDPVRIVQEAGWASGLVWTGSENLTPTGIRSPDHPARRQSLYQLRYPARYMCVCVCVYIYIYVYYTLLDDLIPAKHAAILMFRFLVTVSVSFSVMGKMSTFSVLFFCCKIF
jgi:hypothetical protein